MNENGCNYHPYLEDRVARVEQKTSDIENRVVALEIHKSETIIKLDHIIEVIEDLKKKVDKITDQPIKRMDMIATAFATSGIALVIGYLFSQAVK